MGLRAWNPWYLRRMISVFMRDIDRHDTETEQCWRFLAAVLDGQEHPAKYALQYTVEGDPLVLHIDGGGQATTVFGTATPVQPTNSTTFRRLT